MRFHLVLDYIIVMLTLIEKVLFIKLFYTNDASALTALRKIRTKNKIKEGRGPVTENGLRRSVKRFEESGNLKNRSHSGRAKLSPEQVE